MRWPDLVARVIAPYIKKYLAIGQCKCLIADLQKQGIEIMMASAARHRGAEGLAQAICERMVKAAERAVAKPEFQAKAAGYLARLRYLQPAKYEVELRDAEARSRHL